MARGRRPKPTGATLTLGRSKKETKLPPPREFSTWAKARWKTHAENLRAAGVLAPDCDATLRVLVSLEETHYLLSREIRKTDLVV